MSEVHSLANLAVITLGAYTMPLISRRLMLPTAVAEFFYGMMIGTFIIGSSNTPDTVKFLSEIGFLLLMYIAGLELDFDRVAGIKRKEFLAYCGYIIFLIFFSYIFTEIMNYPKFFVITLITSAIGLLVAVLKELGIIKTAVGQMLILLGVMGEVVTLGGITIVSLTHKVGSGDTKEVIFQLLWIAAFLTIVYLSLRILKLLLWWYPASKSFFMSVGNPSEIGIRANLFNLFIFATLAAAADLEPILGAFLGGAIFSKLFAQREEMLERLSGFGYGFLIPLFFIEVGTRFRLGDFTQWTVLKGAVILSILLLLTRMLATIPLFFTDISKKQLIYVPFGQAIPLTLLVAGSTIGENLGFIDKQQSSIIILTAVITAIFYPWMIKILYKLVPIDR